MATVVRVPRDTRFGELGAGIGNVFEGQQRRKQEEAAQALIDSYLSEAGIEVDPAFADKLSESGLDLEVPQMMSILSQVGEESQRRRVETEMAEIAAGVAAGDFTPEQAAIKSLEVDPDNLNSALSFLTASERTDIMAARESREAGESAAAETRRAEADALIQGARERYNAGEIDLPTFLTESLNAQNIGQVAPALIRAETPTTVQRQTVNLTKPGAGPGGRDVVRQVRIPVDSNPADHPSVARLLDQGFELGKLSGTEESVGTQFDQRVNATAAAHGLDTSDPAERSRAVNATQNMPQVVRFLDNAYKVRIEGSDDLQFQSRRNQMTYNLALENAERRLAAGESPAVASRNAQIDADNQFFSSDIIPPTVQETIVSSSVTAPSFEEGKINAAASIGVWLVNSQEFTNDDAEIYVYRVLGPGRNEENDAKLQEVGLPTISQEEYIEVQNLIRSMAGPGAPIAPTQPGGSSMIDLLRGLFQGSGE